MAVAVSCAVGFLVVNQLAATELDARQAAGCGLFARLPLALLSPDGSAAAR